MTKRSLRRNRLISYIAIIIVSNGRVYKFDGLLILVKEYIVDQWEIRKHKY